MRASLAKGYRNEVMGTLHSLREVLRLSSFPISNGKLFGLDEQTASF